MKEKVLVKPEDAISALRLLQLLNTAVDGLMDKLQVEKDEQVKQALRGGIAAYVELHSVILEQVKMSRLEEDDSRSGQYDA